MFSICPLFTLGLLQNHWMEDKIANSLRMPRISRNIMMLRAMATACEAGVDRKRKLVMVT